MSNVADDVANFLQSKGIGSRNTLNGWGIAVDNEPPSPPAPDKIITVYNTGGFAPIHSAGIRHPTVQVRARGSPNEDGTVPYNKLEEARNALMTGPFKRTWVMGDITNLGLDDSSRPIFTLNFRFEKEEF
ncbi:MAG: minor capsid protein [Candidatus Pacebacteria bacterium]|nr:minor capsid protein [Candidatus Paceibacterota bacterium]